ncbi:hypothetical protein QN277_001881 [Acacia crassicarpa]|uniref:ADP-ribosyl cyclase/cyclic ADP-ribose hydrolase n=1 Tax=Acacia crassicarpa TaxID=499986 RepID=A0AAE1N801_9FABA|nr:hypothetical protein QN277_001881 [Acacia crassicarpa]
MQIRKPCSYISLSEAIKISPKAQRSSRLNGYRHKEIFINGSSSSPSRPIHVYLSFRGDDETCKFTDVLWAALETNNLNTFLGDKKLDPADSIFLPRHFLKAIQQSNISVVVFSKSHASSIWCLEEL